MDSFENIIRRDIELKFGSIPKMSDVTGIPRNTIYHALERGLDNTTVKTRSAILDALYGPEETRFEIADPPAPALSPDELHLLETYRACSQAGRRDLLEMAAFVQSRHPLNQGDSAREIA